jgi:hypothetical protein
VESESRRGRREFKPWSISVATGVCAGAGRNTAAFPYGCQHQRLSWTTDHHLHQSLALLSRSPLLLSSDLDPLASSTTPDWNPTQLKSSTVAI